MGATLANETPDPWQVRVGPDGKGTVVGRDKEGEGFGEDLGEGVYVGRFVVQAEDRGPEPSNEGRSRALVLVVRSLKTRLGYEGASTIADWEGPGVKRLQGPCPHGAMATRQVDQRGPTAVKLLDEADRARKGDVESVPGAVEEAVPPEEPQGLESLVVKGYLCEGEGLGQRPADEVLVAHAVELGPAGLMGVRPQDAHLTRAGVEEAAVQVQHADGAFPRPAEGILKQRALFRAAVKYVPRH